MPDTVSTASTLADPRTHPEPMPLGAMCSAGPGPAGAGVTCSAHLGDPRVGAIYGVVLGAARMDATYDVSWPLPMGAAQVNSDSGAALGAR